MTPPRNRRVVQKKFRRQDALRIELLDIDSSPLPPLSHRIVRPHLLILEKFRARALKFEFVEMLESFFEEDRGSGLRRSRARVLRPVAVCAPASCRRPQRRRREDTSSLRIDSQALSITVPIDSPISALATSRHVCRSCAKPAIFEPIALSTVVTELGLQRLHIASIKDSSGKNPSFA